MQPTVTLEAPYQAPPNAVRVTNAYAMVRIVPPLPESLTYVYDVGIASTLEPRTFTITNLALNAQLVISITKPTFVTLDAPLTFTLAPQTSRVITVKLSEEVVQQMSMGACKIYNETLEILATPTNDGSPVFMNSVDVMPNTST